MTCILQDRQGFMWFGTTRGLKCYEGHECRTWLYDPADEQSLYDDMIWALLEDRNGVIWIGTEKGLNSFDPQTVRFVRHNVFNSETGLSFGQEPVVALTEDRKGNLWIGTPNGIYVLDENRQVKRRYHFGEKGEVGFMVRKMVRDQQDQIWLSTNDTTNWISTWWAYLLCILLIGSLAYTIYRFLPGRNHSFRKAELLRKIQQLLESHGRIPENDVSHENLEEPAPASDTTIPSEKQRELLFLKKVRTEIEAHLSDSDFSVHTLATTLHYSEAQLYRKIKSTTGQSPGKFIRSIKIAAAKRLLQDPEVTVMAVAYDIGYQDSEYFSKVFKQEVGETPSEYRSH